MAQSRFSHTRHHIYNLQKPSGQRSPLINSTFTVNGTTFSGAAMLDSGCSTCIVPISQLPKEARKHITRSDAHIKGINGSITAIGELNCNITIGNHDSPIFDGINVLVTAQSTPILIGQNILGHNTLDSYKINNQDATVKFRRTIASGLVTHTAPLIRARNHVGTFNNNPVYGAQAIGSSESRPTATPVPIYQTLEEKLRWLKRNTGLSLPNHPNRDELEGVTTSSIHRHPRHTKRG